MSEKARNVSSDVWINNSSVTSFQRTSSVHNIAAHELVIPVSYGAQSGARRGNLQGHPTVHILVQNFLSCLGEQDLKVDGVAT